MRILIIGFIVFVIWSIFSVWLYVEKLKPAMNEKIAVQEIPEIQPTVTDSVIQPEAIPPPKDMIIYFDFDDARLISDSQRDNSVTEYKEWLNKNSESKLSITGYTDDIGTPQYNMKLGTERAKAVQNYFQSKGVDAAKIMVDSRGEDQPINAQSSEEERAKNRRVVITIKN